MNMYEILKDVIPKDHSRQVTCRDITDLYILNNYINNVIDLGCGKGNLRDYFKMKNPNIKWVGVDIELSPAVNLRNITDSRFIIFDGINLPFDNDSIDMTFSNQVFEHVRYPRELLKEVRRILSPRGYFIGSVSYLEPFHSNSLWNFTPYGFKILIEESGMKLKELRPSIDALTLIVRRALKCHNFFNRFWRKESPLNRLIDFVGFICGKEHDEINLIKLLFCGQFVFMVQKNE